IYDYATYVLKLKLAHATARLPPAPREGLFQQVRRRAAVSPHPPAELVVETGGMGFLKSTFDSPPIVVTNPEVVKYLICQLFTEAVLVLTLVFLIPSILWEEFKHWSRRRTKRRNTRQRARELGKAAMGKGQPEPPESVVQPRAQGGQAKDKTLFKNPKE
ncbi:hypothetical protein THAOC_00143, partial [Thalassiosira oceanica]